MKAEHRKLIGLAYNDLGDEEKWKQPRSLLLRAVHEIGKAECALTDRQAELYVANAIAYLLAYLEHPG